MPRIRIPTSPFPCSGIEIPSLQPLHSTMGKPAFFVLCGSFAPRAKPPCINARFWKPGSILDGVVTIQQYPISRHRTTTVWLHHLGVPFSISISILLCCVAISCISLLLSNIFPQHCAIPMLLLPSHGSKQYKYNTCWGSCLPWLDYMSPKKENISNYIIVVTP